VLRVLLLADTHLGFDEPLRPRSDRLRRGPDFFRCADAALEPARRREVDLVVHGGDLLYRSRVPASLVARALEGLLTVADRGVPVVLVPGNHERSALPYPLLAAHEHLFVLDRPRTVRLRLAGLDVAVSGFPCERDDIAARFGERLATTGWAEPADIRLLCLHQTVEGATVGPGNFTFRQAPDIIPGRAIPAGFAAVLAGHIHRHQVLTRDLTGRPLLAPVIYPGSTERTSFAEQDETKGYTIVTVLPERKFGGRVGSVVFHELAARPMSTARVNVSGLKGEALSQRLRSVLAGCPADGVVRLDVEGLPAPGAEECLRVATLRTLHPPTMVVTVRWPRR
jgi:DNA repair protein SbcD/Mre11